MRVYSECESWKSLMNLSFGQISELSSHQISHEP